MKYVVGKWTQMIKHILKFVSEWFLGGLEGPAEFSEKRWHALRMLESNSIPRRLCLLMCVYDFL